MGWPSPCPGIRLLVQAHEWRTKGHTWRARDQKVSNSAPGAGRLHRGGPCDYWRQGVCSPLTGVRLARLWHWTAEAWPLPQAFLVASYRNLWEPVWAKSTFQCLGTTEAHGRQGQRCRRALEGSGPGNQKESRRDVLPAFPLSLLFTLPLAGTVFPYPCSAGTATRRTWVTCCRVKFLSVSVEIVSHLPPHQLWLGERAIKCKTAPKAVWLAGGDWQWAEESLLPMDSGEQSQHLPAISQETQL